MSHLTKPPQSTLRLWLRLGRLMALTGLISLLALWGLLGCTTQPDDEVVVVVPTPAPATPQPTSPPSPTSTAPHLHPKEWAGLSDIGWRAQGLTLQLEFHIRNQTSLTSTSSTLYIFDGRPEAEAQVIDALDIAAIPPESIHRLRIPWDATGKAGEQQIFRFLCPPGLLPTAVNCYTIGNTLNIPRLSANLEISGAREIWRHHKIDPSLVFYRGDQVPITAWVANLDATQPLSVTFIVKLDRLSTKDVLLEQQTLVLSPGDMFERTYTYEIMEESTTGEYITLDVSSDERDTVKTVSFRLSDEAYFMADPISGITPLTITFRDVSSLRPSDNKQRLWDFGDGITSTLAHPTHTYTIPGAYTVTLAVSLPTSELLWAQDLMIAGITRTGRITQEELLPSIYTYTISRSSYINVMPQ